MGEESREEDIAKGRESTRLSGISPYPVEEWPRGSSESIQDPTIRDQDPEPINVCLAKVTNCCTDLTPLDVRKWFDYRKVHEPHWGVFLGPKMAHPLIQP